MKDPLRRDDLTRGQRNYMRKKIKDLASDFKYAVDAVHSGSCTYRQLADNEKVDFELYFLLIDHYPYEWIDD